MSVLISHFAVVIPWLFIVHFDVCATSRKIMQFARQFTLVCLNLLLNVCSSELQIPWDFFQLCYLCSCYNSIYSDYPCWFTWSIICLVFFFFLFLSGDDISFQDGHHFPLTFRITFTDFLFSETVGCCRIVSYQFVLFAMCMYISFFFTSLVT